MRGRKHNTSGPKTHCQGHSCQQAVHVRDRAGRDRALPGAASRPGVIQRRKHWSLEDRLGVAGKGPVPEEPPPLESQPGGWGQGAQAKETGHGCGSLRPPLPEMQRVLHVQRYFSSARGVSNSTKSKHKNSKKMFSSVFFLRISQAVHYTEEC